jgi:N-acetylmuramoyl-L-alanine amidase CwlA
MNIHKLFLANNDCYKANQQMTPAGVMIHSTGANNPYLSRYLAPDDGRIGKNKYQNDWNRPGLQQCCHAFIGKLADNSVAVYQTLPFDICCWSSGSGSLATAKKHNFPGNNANFLGFVQLEICEDDLTDTVYFNAVYAKAVDFAAYICRTYDIPTDPRHVLCHSEGHALGIASNHADVMHWFPKHGKTMDDFRSDVRTKIAENASEKSDSCIYRVQVGAFSNKENAEQFLQTIKKAGLGGFIVED